MIKFSAEKSIWLVLIGCALYVIIACQPKEKITPSPEFLFGKWSEKESEEIIQFGGTNHIFEFTKDAFFLERLYWTDALVPDDDCVNGHTDFFTGTYQLENGQLIIDGLSANEDFVLTLPICNRSATYRDTFNLLQENEQVLILNPDEEVYFQIRLEKN